MVCKNLCKGLIELRHTAITNAKKVERGTVSMQRSIVFAKQVKKPWYFITAVKLPKPGLKVEPPTDSMLLKPSKNAILKVFIIGHTVNTRSNMIAGVRYNHAFH